MRMAAEPSSLVETPDALLIRMRSGGICAGIPPEPACGGGVSRTGDRPPREPTDRGAAAREQ